MVSVMPASSSSLGIGRRGHQGSARQREITALPTTTAAARKVYPSPVLITANLREPPPRRPPPGHPRRPDRVPADLEYRPPADRPALAGAAQRPVQHRH